MKAALRTQPNALPRVPESQLDDYGRVVRAIETSDGDGARAAMSQVLARTASLWIEENRLSTLPAQPFPCAAARSPHRHFPPPGAYLARPDAAVSPRMRRARDYNVRSPTCDESWPIRPTERLALETRRQEWQSSKRKRSSTS
ncbi:hypothetical protein BPUN_1473 [Candidatus Paraburkholderia kirkii]|nr:hypothetical protein BPUN_1473 [Candidatus Paraburkholderia kirkii]